MDEYFQAAVGLVQLRRLDEMNETRYRKAKNRTEMLKDMSGLTLPYEPPGYKHTYYLYTCMVPYEWGGEKRDQLMSLLQKGYGVGCGILNPPTYQMRPFIRERTKGQNLPGANKIGERIFVPSLHPLMSDEDNEYIAAAISEAYEEVSKEKIGTGGKSKEYKPRIAIQGTIELFKDKKKQR
jgi:perosamine synthetase